MNIFTTRNNLRWMISYCNFYANVKMSINSHAIVLNRTDSRPPEASNTPGTDLLVEGPETLPTDQQHLVYEASENRAVWADPPNPGTYLMTYDVNTPPTNGQILSYNETNGRSQWTNMPNFTYLGPYTGPSMTPPNNGYLRVNTGAKSIDWVLPNYQNLMASGPSVAPTIGQILLTNNTGSGGSIKMVWTTPTYSSLRAPDPTVNPTANQLLTFDGTRMVWKSPDVVADPITTVRDIMYYDYFALKFSENKLVVGASYFIVGRATRYVGGGSIADNVLTGSSDNKIFTVVSTSNVTETPVKDGQRIYISNRHTEIVYRHHMRGIEEYGLRWPSKREKLYDFTKSIAVTGGTANGTTVFDNWVFRKGTASYTNVVDVHSGVLSNSAKYHLFKAPNTASYMLFHNTDKVIANTNWDYSFTISASPFGLNERLRFTSANNPNSDDYVLFGLARLGSDPATSEFAKYNGYDPYNVSQKAEGIFFRFYDRDFGGATDTSVKALCEATVRISGNASNLPTKSDPTPLFVAGTNETTDTPTINLYKNPTRFTISCRANASGSSPVAQLYFWVEGATSSSTSTVPTQNTQNRRVYNRKILLFTCPVYGTENLTSGDIDILNNYFYSNYLTPVIYASHSTSGGSADPFHIYDTEFTQYFGRLGNFIETNNYNGGADP